jgi:hypothetical protein
MCIFAVSWKWHPYVVFLCPFWRARRPPLHPHVHSHLQAHVLRPRNECWQHADAKQVALLAQFKVDLRGVERAARAGVARPLQQCDAI